MPYTTIPQTIDVKIRQRIETDRKRVSYTGYIETDSVDNETETLVNAFVETAKKRRTLRRIRKVKKPGLREIKRTCFNKELLTKRLTGRYGVAQFKRIRDGIRGLTCNNRKRYPKGLGIVDGLDLYYVKKGIRPKSTDTEQNGYIGYLSHHRTYPNGQLGLRFGYASFIELRAMQKMKPVTSIEIPETSIEHLGDMLAEHNVDGVHLLDLIPKRYARLRRIVLDKFNGVALNGTDRVYLHRTGKGILSRVWLAQYNLLTMMQG